jgi:hypothetical protein
VDIYIYIYIYRERERERERERVQSSVLGQWRVTAMFWPSAYFYNGAGNWCFNRPYMGFLLGKIIKFLFMV